MTKKMLISNIVIFKAEKIFSAFFFANKKTFPIFAVFNIYRREAGDVRQSCGLFLCPYYKHIIP